MQIYHLDEIYVIFSCENILRFFPSTIMKKSWIYNKLNGQRNNRRTSNDILKFQIEMDWMVSTRQQISIEILLNNDGGDHFLA